MKLLRKFPPIVIITIIAIMGSIMIYMSTNWGPWVFSDSTGYIVAARNLIAGRGLGLYKPSGIFQPLSLHPPFYSLVLSFFGLFGADMLTTARWMDIILFGLTILFVGVTLYTITRSAWLSILGSFLLFCMPVLVNIFSGVMSEPLFIFIGLVSILLLLLFLRNNHFILLLTAGITSGLAMITRYSGPAFIFTGIFVLLVYSHKALKKRINDVIIYGILGCLPIIGWLTWLRIQSAGARSLQMRLNVGQQFTQFRLAIAGIFWSWLPFTSHLPRYTYDLARNIILIFIFLILVLFYLTIWKMHKNNQKIFESTNGFFVALLLIVFAVAYLFILALSYFYTYPPPDLIPRTFLPIQIAVLLAVFSLFLFFIRAWQSVKWLKIIPIALLLGISISYLHDSIVIVSYYHQYGAGYTCKAMRNSKLIYLVEQFPSNIPIISNESALVLFYTGHPAYDISELMNSEPQAITNRFGDALNDPAQKVFRENGAALVLFQSIFWQLEHLYGTQTSQRMENLTKGLSLYAQEEDGAVYFYPSAKLP